jgi:hypothetical protein
MFVGGNLFLYYYWRRLRSCTSNICSQRRRVYWFYCVHFPHCLFGFVLFYYLSLSSYSLLVHFPLIVWVSVFFCFCKHFFATIHLNHVHFPHHWVYIVLLFVLVFLFFTWSFPSLLFGFWIFLFFQTFFCNNPLVYSKWMISYNLVMLLPQLLGVLRLCFGVVHMLPSNIQEHWEQFCKIVTYNILKQGKYGFCSYFQLNEVIR